MNANVLLLLEAKDNASARLKAFGGAVQQAGQQADITSAKTAKLGGSMTGMMERVKAAQIPLRNLSAILGGFGLSFLGISAATMGLRGLISQAITADRAFLTIQLNMRRFGLSMDEASRRARELRSILGSTAMVELAGMIDAFEEWRVSMALTREQGNDVLALLREYAKWMGTDLPTAFKELEKYQEQFGKAEGIKSFAQATRDAKNNATEFREAMVLMGETWGPISERIAAGSLIMASNIIISLDLFSKGFRRLPSALQEGLSIWKGWILDFGKNLYIDLIQPWVNLGVYLWEWGVWAIGFFPDVWGRVVKSGAETWAGFLGFWVKLGNSIAGFWVDKWTAIAEWWGKLTTGMADFWRGVWDGMKGVGISVYNFIVDRLNDALVWANAVILVINSALGRVGLHIPEIDLSIARATLPAPEVFAPAPVFAAPTFAPAWGGATSTFIIQIGDKRLAEIIVDTLTGEVRQKELSE